MKRIIVTIAMVILLTLSIYKVANASWYSGIYSAYADGISAKIKTPSVSPTVVKAGGVYNEVNGTSNWVSTAYHDTENDAYWLQTGWLFYQKDTNARRYVEYCIDCWDSDYAQDKFYYGNQAWNSEIEYKVVRTGSMDWCAYIAGVLRSCVYNLHADPDYMQVMSEIHNDSRNAVDTYFKDVRYKDRADSQWKLVVSADTLIHFPYNLQVIHNYYEFRTYKGTILDKYIPSITN